jgi:hypothetical protein
MLRFRGINAAASLKLEGDRSRDGGNAGVISAEKGMAVPCARARRRRRAPPHWGFGHVEFGTSAIAGNAEFVASNAA